MNSSSPFPVSPAFPASSFLAHYGFDSFFEQAFGPHAELGLSPGRVVTENRGAVVVVTEDGERTAEPSGRLYHLAASREELPAVGDWVALRPTDDSHAIIHAVLPRRSAFVRGLAGGTTEAQVVAANVDFVFLVCAAIDLNPRRLERYVSVARTSHASPVVVVTKCDAVENSEERRAELEAIGEGLPLHFVSGLTGERVDELFAYFVGAKTIALLGTSGAGKSTLANRLLGDEVQHVSHVADDGRGRHTTTQRHLVALPRGGLVLDTPGMRELRLWDSGDARDGLDDTFGEIATLAAQCRFRDCRHDGEPGCAVEAARDAGTLDEGRWTSYLKLERELTSLAVRQDARKLAERKRASKVIERALRARPNRKD